MAAEQINVMILLFEGVNTLDVNGPLEVLCNYSLRQEVGDNPVWSPFKIYVAAKEAKSVQAFEFIHMVACTDYSEALKMIETKQIDVLITPGFATNDVIKNLISSGDKIFDLIQAFFNLEVTSSDKPKWLISICTGGLLNAHAGVFDGRQATTHFLALAAGELATYSNNQAIPVRQRWVDGGTTAQGVRIASSGGISCGLDCMLWFVSEVKDLPTAQGVAYMMDYAWNGGPPQAEGRQPTVQ